MSAIVSTILYNEWIDVNPLGKEAYRLIHRITKGKRYRRYTVAEIFIKELGDFTEVEVALSHEKKPSLFLVGTGFSKKSPRDPWNSSIGRTVALSRAIRDSLDIPATHVAQ